MNARKVMVALGAMVVLAGSAACSASSTGTGTGTSTGGGNALCPSGTYTADVGGAAATAHVTLEILTEVTYVSGDIRSATAYYTFTGEAYGSTGWVDVLDHGTNQRFRAQVDAAGDGFVFTANAYEGAYSTQYQFKCQR